jgi:hypothetical protein
MSSIPNSYLSVRRANNSTINFNFVLFCLQWEGAMTECCRIGMKLLSIDFDYKRLSLQAAIACKAQINLYILMHLIKANLSIPTGMYWTSGSDEGCERKFGWCSVNKLVRNAQWASAQPDNAGGLENCLALNLDAASPR